VLTNTPRDIFEKLSQASQNLNTGHQVSLKLVAKLVQRKGIQCYMAKLKTTQKDNAPDNVQRSPAPCGRKVVAPPEAANEATRVIELIKLLNKLAVKSTTKICTERDVTEKEVVTILKQNSHCPLPNTF
jgi:hypothetical protein